MSKITRLAVAEEGSPMQAEFKKEHDLAEQLLAEAKVAELYQKRCTQLDDMGKTLGTMVEMYTGKHGNSIPIQHAPDAVRSMERVALAAIALAEAVAGKAKAK